MFGGRVRETKHFANVFVCNVKVCTAPESSEKFVTKQIFCQESCVMVNAFSFFRKGASCQTETKERASSYKLHIPQAVVDLFHAVSPFLAPKKVSSRV